MLAQDDRKTPARRKRSPRPAVDQPRPTVVVEAPPAPDGSDGIAAADPYTLPTRRVGKTTARPVSRADRRLMERAEWMANAMPILEPETKALAAIETPMPPAPTDEPSARPLIVVGDATSKMVAMRVGPPPRKKRHWVSGSIILALIVTVSLTAIATVTPLASGKSEGLAVHAAGPLGLPVALDAANKPPSGQWVAMIGAQPNQDVGGGAGPGVQAPGSAGL